MYSRSVALVFVSILAIISVKASSLEPSIFESLRPALDRSDDVYGPDVNKDGVRDDIASFIAGADVTEQQRRYLMHYAAGMQRQVTYEQGAIDNPDQFARDMAQADVCVLSSFDDLEKAVFYHKKVQNYTANTKERARRLFAYSGSRDGTVVRLPSAESCPSIVENSNHN